MTLDAVAVSLHPIGIECSSCVRRALITAKTLNAKRGDRRTLEEAGLRCSVCGSRQFTATSFQSRSRIHSFLRNL